MGKQNVMTECVLNCGLLVKLMQETRKGKVGLTKCGPGGGFPVLEIKLKQVGEARRARRGELSGPAAAPCSGGGGVTRSAGLALSLVSNPCGGESPSSPLDDSSPYTTRLIPGNKSPQLSLTVAQRNTQGGYVKPFFRKWDRMIFLVEIKVFFCLFGNEVDFCSQDS